LKKLHFYNLFFFVVLIVIFSTTSLQSQSKIEASEEIDPYCKGIDYNDFEKLYNTPPKNIKVLIPQSKNYYENLTNASFTGNYINEKFKNQLNGFVEIYYGDLTCKFNAEIRISGDWKDHINLENYISSLDVSLVNGNIQGITKFKLFLPHTRNFENEIFVATILKEFNVLSPRTFKVNLNFNDYFKGEFIFQEKIVKELIENNNLRESLIIESDETYVWNNSENLYFRNMDEISRRNLFISSKFLNKLWVSKNKSNYEIYKLASALFNRALFSSINGKFNFNSESFNNFEITKFETLSYALKFRHGTIPHNRKFYFNRFTNEFMPIYYDGSPLFLNNSKIDTTKDYSFDSKIITAAQILKTTEINIDKLKDNLSQNGINYSIDKLDKLIEDLYFNLNYISTQDQIVENEKVVINNYFLTNKQEKKAIFSFNDKLKHCSKSVYIECNDYSEVDLSILNSNLGNDEIYFGDFETFFYGNLKKLIKTNINGLYLFSVNKPDYKYLEKENTLILKINNINQRYKLVFSEENSPKKIELDINEDIEPYYSNNDFLLTGCLTIYNSKFEYLEIKVSNSFCEDALNIINSSGYIKSINITSSSFDVLDINYSTVLIDLIDVKSADNDCVDLSMGNYEINKINASNCLDKGISIGENSKVSIDTSIINNSKTAVAIKDYSLVEINNLETFNSDFCLKIYQKKQEFGPSKLSVSNLICDSNYFVQNGSILEQ